MVTNVPSNPYLSDGEGLVSVELEAGCGCLISASMGSTIALDPCDLHEVPVYSYHATDLVRTVMPIPQSGDHHLQAFKLDNGVVFGEDGEAIGPTSWWATKTDFIEGSGGEAVPLKRKSFHS